MTRRFWVDPTEGDEESRRPVDNWDQHVDAQYQADREHFTDEHWATALERRRNDRLSSELADDIANDRTTDRSIDTEWGF